MCRGGHLSGCSPSELTGIVLEETGDSGPDVVGQEKVRMGQSEQQKVWSDGEGQRAVRDDEVNRRGGGGRVRSGTGDPD